MVNNMQDYAELFSYIFFLDVGLGILNKASHLAPNWTAHEQEQTNHQSQEYSLDPVDMLLCCIKERHEAYKTYMVVILHKKGNVRAK